MTPVQENPSSAPSDTSSEDDRYARLKLRLRTDPQFFFENILKIVDKNSELVEFRPNEQQLILINLTRALVECQLPVRIIILKARQMGFCGSPETKVLTSDLRWITLDQILPGQEIVSVDEHTPGGRGRARKMRRAVVEAKTELRSKALKLTMDDGRILTLTPEHRMLCLKRGSKETEWRAAGKMRPGDKIRYITKPWEESTCEDGWFGGMIDGEGSLAKKSRAGAHISVCQRMGDVYDAASGYLKTRGYTYREEIDERHDNPGRLGNQTVGKLIVSRMNEVFRLVGQTRPKRFVNSAWWEGKDLPGKRTGDAWSRVVKIENLPEQRMVDLQTSTSTYIAEGFVSHNSTAVEGLAFQEASMNPYRRVKIVAHKDDSTANLFEMSRLFHREMHPSLKPMTRYSSKTELDFQNPKDEHSSPGLRSYIRVSTAGGKGVGRSDTIQFLHLSEVAFWENAATVANSLAQSVPIVPGTKVYLESTANGIGGHFHDQYWKHKDGKEQLIKSIFKDWQSIPKLKQHLTNFRGNLGYIPLFFPWHEFPEYQIKVTDQECDWLRKSLDPEEKQLMTEHNLTLAQIKWRRWKIEELSEDSEGTHPEDLFKQEYPSTDREAFISRGSNMFSSTALDKMPKESPKHRWNLVDGETKFEYSQPFVPPAHTSDPYGELSVFKKPEAGHQYILACDVAEGVGQDRSVMEVIDKRTLEQCAEYVSDKVSPDVFGRLAVQVASWYNEAQLAIEWNSAGQASIIAVRDTLYPNIYFRESNYDKIQDEPTEMWGFKTTSATKPMILWEMEKHIRQRTVVFHSEALITECREFTVEKSPTGSTVRLSAPEGKHDDRVMAMAIALQVYREYPHEWKNAPGQELYKTDDMASMEQQEFAEDEVFGDL